MENYFCWVEDSQLFIVKKNKRRIVEKIYIIIKIGILAILLSAVFSYAKFGKLKAELFTFLTFIIIAMALAFYFKLFRRYRPVSIKRENGRIIFDSADIGSSVTEIILDEYVSSDMITNYKDVKIKAENKIYYLLGGVKNPEAFEIANSLKEFLNDDEIEIIETIH